MDLFIPIRFRTTVQLAPSELRNNFIEILADKLRKNLEGVCSRYGYIRPGSIEILHKSAGKFVKQHFNGHIYFEIICRAEVCNPPQGSIIKAIVRNKNSMGILAESFLVMDGKEIPVLDIIVPKRAAGIVSQIDLESIQINDEIYVSVQGKRFQLRDKKISIIGKGVSKPNDDEVIANEGFDVSDQPAAAIDDENSDDEVGSTTSSETSSEPEELSDEEEDTGGRRGGNKKKEIIIDDQILDLTNRGEYEDDEEDIDENDDDYDENEDEVDDYVEDDY